MGFMEIAKGIIAKIRAMGKTESEIEHIVEKASEQTSANKDALQEIERDNSNIKRQDSMDALTYALKMAGITANDAAKVMQSLKDRKSTKKTNNWRRMHGLPMRRKLNRRKRRERGKRADSN